MFTTESDGVSFEKIEKVLLSIKRSAPILSKPPVFTRAERLMSIREAVFSPYKVLTIDKCDGKVLASNNVGCPPAVPIAVPGEKIDEKAIECFKYYGYKTCLVVDKKL